MEHPPLSTQYHDEATDRLLFDVWLMALNLDAALTSAMALANKPDALAADLLADQAYLLAMDAENICIRAKEAAERFRL